MRILLAWASKNKKTDDLITALKNAGHEVPYWVGAVGHKTNKISDTVVHCYEDARNCIPASGIQVSDFSPPEESLVKQLHESESLILTMMNKHFDWMCVDERKHLYFNMLQYWNGVFKKYHPQVIIFSLLPHTPFLYVIYALAQLFGIKTIMFDGIAIGVPLGDRKIIFVNSWKKNSALERSMEKNKGKNFSLKDLSLDLQDYYMLHVAKSVDPTPVYLKNEKKLYSFQKILYKKIKILWKSIINMTFFEKALLYLAKRGKQNIKQEYQSLQKEADMEKKFIYLPLNYQPECTTSPQGDMFADQILMTETMAASLPADWNLYVKEHPAQWFTRGMNFFSSRYRGYYEKIARLKNVRLIPIDTDHYELLHHAQCIATVTGTAGFEALMRGKPAIVFGYPWYMECHGVFKVNGVLSCKKALGEIIGGFKIQQQQIINFLKSFDDAAFHGSEVIEDMHYKTGLVKERKNMDNTIQAVLEEIDIISGS